MFFFFPLRRAAKCPFQPAPKANPNNIPKRFSILLLILEPCRCLKGSIFWGWPKWKIAVVRLEVLSRCNFKTPLLQSKIIHFGAFQPRATNSNTCKLIMYSQSHHTMANAISFQMEVVGAPQSIHEPPDMCISALEKTSGESTPQ